MTLEGSSIKATKQSGLSYYAVFIALTIIGFEFISFFVEDSASNSRAVTVPYRAFYLFLIAFLLVRQRFITTVSIPRYFILVLMFWLAYLLKAVLDFYFRFNEIKDFAADYFLFAIGLCFLPMFPMLLPLKENTLKSAKLYTLVLATFANVWGFKNNYLIAKEAEYGRFLGNEILNQISFGQTGVILVILAITSLFTAHGSAKLLFAVLILLGLANVGLAGSRGPMIQLILCLLLLVVLNIKKIGLKNFLFLIAGVTFTAIYFADELVLFNTVMDRLSETGFDTERGNAERYYLFTEGWQMFLDNPLLGGKVVGLYPHNLILESLMALGILGGILLTLIFSLTIYVSIRVIKYVHLSWLGLLMVMQIVAAFTSGNIYNNFLLWPLMALLFNIHNKFNYDQQCLVTPR